MKLILGLLGIVSTTLFIAIMFVSAYLFYPALAQVHKAQASYKMPDTHRKTGITNSVSLSASIS